MGIDELLNFIESKDNKKNGMNNGKKSKKKAISTITNLNTNTAKKVNSENSSTMNKAVSDPIIENGACHDDDNELELFKNKLLGDSIDATVIKKIKPNITSKWD